LGGVVEWYGGGGEPPEGRRDLRRWAHAAVPVEVKIGRKMKCLPNKKYRYAPVCPFNNTDGSAILGAGEKWRFSRKLNPRKKIRKISDEQKARFSFCLGRSSEETLYWGVHIC